MLPWSADLAGRIDEHVISSELLRGNPLGDPHERPLTVYLPPGYDQEPDRREVAAQPPADYERERQRDQPADDGGADPGHREGQVPPGDVGLESAVGGVAG